MQLVSLRIITADVHRLADFYEAVTGTAVTFFTGDFGELRLPGFTLAIAGTATLRLFPAEMASPAANRSAIIEFRVQDVDADYRRLSGMIGSALVQMPTTMPWGNRSLIFRDPDGNLVNLFTPMTDAAVRRVGADAR